MSRSRKKNGIIKDKGHLAKHYNRMFRRINKQRINQGKEPKLIKEIVNDYDICDWIYKWTYGYQFENQDIDNQEFMHLKRKYFFK